MIHVAYQMSLWGFDDDDDDDKRMKRLKIEQGRIWSYSSFYLQMPTW